jgi:hypothetical protein
MFETMKTTKTHPIFGEIPVKKKAPDSPKVRSQRRDQRKREAARERLLNGLSPIDFSLLLWAGKISDYECFILSHAPITQAKQLLRQIQLRHRIAPTDTRKPPIKRKAHIRVPKHVIREKNRPATLPRLVFPYLPTRSPYTVEETVNFLHEKRRIEEPVEKMLDWFQWRSGLEWDEARAIISHVSRTQGRYQ